MIKSLNWELKPLISRLHLDDFIAMTDDFNFHGYELGIEKDALFSLKECTYKITSKLKQTLNNIHPDTLQGAGEITTNHGFLPILYLAVFNKRFVKRTSEIAFLFADENGNEVKLLSYKDLKTQLQRMEVYSEEVRPLLETLGYVDKVYHLNEIDSDSTHSYF